MACDDMGNLMAQGGSQLVLVLNDVAYVAGAYDDEAGFRDPSIGNV